MNRIMGFESKKTIEVRFADVDMMGHVNNAIYFNYFEQARMKFFEDLVEREWDWSKDGLIIAHNEVDYLSPIRLHDEVVITTRCTDMGTKSMTISYNVHRAASEGEVLCAKGSSVLVSYDYQRGSTQEIPEIWKRAFA